MELNFTKYQGTGNDFVMLDNIDGAYDNLKIENIQFLCDRKMGIGADGLIKISSHSEYDFEVEYFNADGTQSFCGNGARCSVAFAKTLNLLKSDTTFIAIDGVHLAQISDDGIVRLEMLPVSEVNKHGNDFVIDTGSPHYIRIVDAAETLDIVDFGKSIRYSETYAKDGINVNLMEVIGNDEVRVETYERGVEDETLSCGTGVTACVLAFMTGNTAPSKVKVITKGGLLAVEATKAGEGFNDIWLSGPAVKVYDGRIDI